jgi:hypothetical protein
MAVISKGITLSYGETVLTNLMEIPDLGGETEKIETTTLDDAAHMYTNGLINYGERLAFKSLYEDEQFAELSGLTGSQQWKVSLPDGTTCSFGGESSVKLDGAGVAAVLTYTLNISPDSEMVWG